MFQSFSGGNAFSGVHGKHFRDKVLCLRTDFCPILVVEAVDALLNLGEQPRLRLELELELACQPINIIQDRTGHELNGRY